MRDRILGIFCFAAALLLCCAVVVALLAGLIEWLQSGRWHNLSLLQAGYDLQLLRARWFLATDWGWRVHELLDQIPLLAAGALLAPLCWWVGLIFVRR